jgi:CPA1 family monovalent cation:H+ antiporter
MGGRDRLGAVVAPDAVAATAVLRELRPPHRLLTILEGESLLNDASALLIYRLAVGAVAVNGFSVAAVAPTFLLTVAGSLVAGPALGWIVLRVMERVQHVPTAIILQFVSTFGVWMLAERIGLSGVLTTVCCAMAVARTAPERISARTRISTNAVWDTVIFALNILAFIFIGLQIGRFSTASKRRTAPGISPLPARFSSPSSSCALPGACPSMW